MKSFMVCKNDWIWSHLWYVRMIENEVLYGMYELKIENDIYGM